MVNFGSDFVKNAERGNATLEDVIGTFRLAFVFSTYRCNDTIANFAAHLDHIRNVTGSTLNVGIGANFDGPQSAAGLGDVSQYPVLFDKLAEEFEFHEPWSRDDLQNLAGLNMLRVMRDVEAYRDSKLVDTQEISIPDGERIDLNCTVTTPAPV